MNKLLQIFFFSSVFFLVFLLSPIIILVHAQLSGCAQIDIGNPPGNISPPSQCSSTGSTNSIHWPFKKKDPTQYRRVDQGWDLQGSTPQIVYAVASGTVHLANADPSGFGNYYPYETLDSPAQGYHSIYYGHIHYAEGGAHYGVQTQNVIGKHVNAGDIIGYTYPGCCWPANWLEIGFGDNVPVGTGSFPTKAGLDMEQYLNGTRRTY